MSVCERRHLPRTTYTPQWAGPIEGYVMNFLAREFWRVARSMEHIDAKQEAYLVYMRCAAKYADMDTPEHFMALFKTCWRNHFIDLANADTERRVEVPLLAVIDEDGDELPILEPVGETENEGAMRVLMRQAPREVLMVLNLFMSAPTELLEMALANWTPDSNRRMSGNAYLNRALGFPPGFDAVGVVREHFAVQSL